jgi:hypothetical protein
MSSYTTLHTRSFIATAALGAYVRVKLSSGEVVAAGAGEASIGVTEAPCAAGTAVSVRLKNSGGTALFTAAGAFANGATVYGVASGKIDDVVGDPANEIVGTALQAATGDGHIVEVLLA